MPDITLLKRTVSTFFDDDAMTQAAALAFYMVTSLAPLLLILVSLAGLIGPRYSADVETWLAGQVGPQAGGAILSFLNSMYRNRGSGIVSLVIGVVALILTATGLLGNVQHALNNIWGIKDKSQNWLKKFFVKRLVSLAILFAAGIILIDSLVITAVLIGISGALYARTVSVVISIALFTVLSAIIFKYLPDAKIRWMDVWIGAAMTAVLFEMGKYLIGLYFALKGVTSGYGAAGSFLALLIWLYYSSVIFLFGAEFTQAYAFMHGSGVQLEHAPVKKQSPKKKSS